MISRLINPIALVVAYASILVGTYSLTWGIIS